MNIEFMKESDELIFGIVRAAIIPAVPPETKTKFDELVEGAKRKQTFSYGIVKMKDMGVLLIPTAIDRYEQPPFKSYFKVSGVDSKSPSSAEELDLDLDMLYHIDDDGIFTPFILKEDYEMFKEAMA